MWRRLIFIIGLTGVTALFGAGVSINRIHSCLALTGFVYQKVSSANATYSAKEIELIRKGLKAYGLYLDRDVIDPKLLALYGGNVAQANVMKKLFNRQQSTFTQHLSERHSESKIATEYAKAIKECSIITGTQGDVALALKKAIDTMVNT